MYILIENTGVSLLNWSTFLYLGLDSFFQSFSPSFFHFLNQSAGYYRKWSNKFDKDTVIFMLKIVNSTV